MTRKYEGVSIKKWCKIIFFVKIRKKTFFWRSGNIVKMPYVQYKHSTPNSLFYFFKTKLPKFSKIDIFVFQIHTRRPMAFSHKIQDLMILAHEEVEIFWNFWFFVHFNRAGKIFFLNRFQKFQKFWKDMNVIRSFLAFKHQGTKLRYSAVPTLSENFGKITNCDSHHPTDRYSR